MGGYTLRCNVVMSRRTQIYLTDAQHRAATRLARRRETTLAAVVREALDRYLAGGERGRVSWEDDPALGLVGRVDMPALPEVAAEANEAIDAIVYEDAIVEEEPWSSPTPRGSSEPSTRATRATAKRRTRGRQSPKRDKGS